ncbi:MAG: CARDB domain-containing protein, partial [Bacteroidota bacterium]
MPSIITKIKTICCISFIVKVLGDFNTYGSEDGFYLDDVSVRGMVADDQPEITLFSPAEEVVGANITIKGRNFSNTQIVRFNGAIADFQIVDDQTLQAIVPAAAQSGPISVETLAGVANSPFDFTLLNGNDLGVSQILSPVSTCGLGTNETVRVVIRNYGTFAVNNFAVQYRVNGGAYTQENINSNLEAGETMEYTFNQGANLSTLGSYTLEANTVLINDEVSQNDGIDYTLEHYPTLEGSISPDQSICKGSFVAITASGGISYQWNNGNPFETLYDVPNSTTSYTVTITDANNCTDVLSTTVTVNAPETPEILIDGNTVLCPGDTTILSSNVTENILWSNESFDPVQIVTTPGTYQVAVFDQAGCSSVSNIVNIQESPPFFIFASNFGTICEGDSETLTVLNASSANWSDGSNTTTASFSPLESTTYSVTATNIYGCTYIDSFLVEVIPNEVPGVVSNMLPLEGSQQSPYPMRFSWAPAENASHYDLYIWPLGDVRPNTPTVSNIGTIAYDYFGFLIFGESYEWNVVARNSCEEGIPGPIQSFSVVELPDLIVEQIEVPTEPVFSGNELNISWIVTNIGSQFTPDTRWYDQAYLSEDLELTFEDIYLGSLANPNALLSQESYSSDLMFQLPEGIEGAFYIIMRTDAYNYLAEADNDNNLLISEQQVQIQLSPPPDLYVEQINPIGVNNLVFSGTQEKVNWLIINQGEDDTESGGWIDQLYFTADSNRLNLTFADRIGLYYHEEDLMAGATRPASVDIQIPELVEGDYYLFIETDRFNDVYEHHLEFNNIQRIGPIQVLPTQRPDLQILPIAALPTVSNNASLSLAW